MTAMTPLPYLKAVRPTGDTDFIAANGVRVESREFEEWLEARGVRLATTDSAQLDSMRTTYLRAKYC